MAIIRTRKEWTTTTTKDKTDQQRRTYCVAVNALRSPVGILEDTWKMASTKTRKEWTTTTTKDKTNQQRRTYCVVGLSRESIGTT